KWFLRKLPRNPLLLPPNIGLLSSPVLQTTTRELFKLHCHKEGPGRVVLQRRSYCVTTEWKSHVE
ncbi:hypothetical protein AVEN_10600-1, partial [Araneus ventricosus]